MAKKIKLKLDALEFDELRTCLAVLQRSDNNIKTILDAYRYETMLGLRLRLKMIPTVMKSHIMISVSIIEAVLLWKISQFDFPSPITNAVMYTIRTQLEKKGERYMAEVRELQQKIMN